MLSSILLLRNNETKFNILYKLFLSKHFEYIDETDDQVN